jgi:hypothetical protein
VHVGRVRDRADGFSFETSKLFQILTVFSSIVVSIADAVLAERQFWDSVRDDSSSSREGNRSPMIDCTLDIYRRGGVFDNNLFTDLDGYTARSLEDAVAQ